MSDIKFKLSNRMKMVTDMITRGKNVADVGCDHAFVSIYLIKKNIATKVVAVDVKEGPLNIAENNISMYCSRGEKDRVVVRASDGFSNVNCGETDAAIIAGMGGPLMARIIEGGINKNLINEGYELVLQPQSEIKEFRAFLRDKNIQIVKEDMLFEEGKYYTVMKCVVGASSGIADEYKTDDEHGDSEKLGTAVSDVSEAIDLGEVYDRYGKYLLDNKSEVLLSYIKNDIELKNSILVNVSKQSKDNPRINELKHDIEIMKYVLLNYYGV